jgi:hypothetical protein
MDYKTKKILLIGFFILLWLFIIFSVYKKNQIFKKQIYTYDFSNKNVFVEDDKEVYKHKTKNNVDNIVLDLPSNEHKLNNKKENYFFNEEFTQESCGDFKCFSPEQFIQMYNTFESKTNLNYRNVSIYDGGLADAYLREFAEKRFYKQRVFAHAEDIISFGNLFTRPVVKESFLQMRDEMKKENLSLHFVSGYRSIEKQKEIFKHKMGNIDSSKIVVGLYDEKINEVLNRSALPGYSKHHSGYAVDFGCGVDYLVYEFATTKCYKWLSKNNFENAKRFGFIPSYPNTLIPQGPDPEPWEFVWVGRDFIEQYLENDENKNEI